MTRTMKVKLRPNLEIVTLSAKPIVQLPSGGDIKGTLFDLWMSGLFVMVNGININFAVHSPSNFTDCLHYGRMILKRYLVPTMDCAMILLFPYLKWEAGLELRPGCDLLQSLEEILNGILGKLRESAGQEAMRTLVRRYAFFYSGNFFYSHGADSRVAPALVKYSTNHG